MTSCSPVSCAWKCWEPSGGGDGLLPDGGVVDWGISDADIVLLRERVDKLGKGSIPRKRDSLGCRDFRVKNPGADMNDLGGDMGCVDVVDELDVVLSCCVLERDRSAGMEQGGTGSWTTRQPVSRSESPCDLAETEE